MAKIYTELKRQLAEQNRKLNIATIFSYSANEADPEDDFPDVGFENEKVDQSHHGLLLMHEGQSYRLQHAKMQ